VRGPPIRTAICKWAPLRTITAGLAAARFFGRKVLRIRVRVECRGSVTRHARRAVRGAGRAQVVDGRQNVAPPGASRDLRDAVVTR
jgi:hypothetical protein